MRTVRLKECKSLRGSHKERQRSTEKASGKNTFLPVVFFQFSSACHPIALILKLRRFGIFSAALNAYGVGKTVIIIVSHSLPSFSMFCRNVCCRFKFFDYVLFFFQQHQGPFPLSFVIHRLQKSEVECLHRLLWNVLVVMNVKWARRMEEKFEVENWQWFLSILKFQKCNLTIFLNI